MAFTKRIVFIVLVFMYVNADEEACKDEDGVQYGNGESFIAADGCNRCTCANGLLGCTRMACVPPQVCEYDGNLYNPGDKFKDDCNTCVCGGNGVVRCTRKACPPVCEHNGLEYKVGETYQDDCNKCRCGPQGEGLCTRKGCPPKVCSYGDDNYAVGEAFVAEDGCNRCTCQENGMAACTLKMCI